MIVSVDKNICGDFGNFLQGIRYAVSRDAVKSSEFPVPRLSLQTKNVAQFANCGIAFVPQRRIPVRRSVCFLWRGCGFRFVIKIKIGHNENVIACHRIFFTVTHIIFEIFSEVASVAPIQGLGIFCTEAIKASHVSLFRSGSRYSSGIYFKLGCSAFFDQVIICNLFFACV